MTMTDATIIREAVQPLTGSAQDDDFAPRRCRWRTVRLLGEVSHGMHEFCAVARTAITKRLMAKRGSTVVAI